MNKDFETSFAAGVAGALESNAELIAAGAAGVADALSPTLSYDLSTYTEDIRPHLNPQWRRRFKDSSYVEGGWVSPMRPVAEISTAPAAFKDWRWQLRTAKFVSKDKPLPNVILSVVFLKGDDNVYYARLKRKPYLGYDFIPLLACFPVLDINKPGFIKALLTELTGKWKYYISNTQNYGHPLCRGIEIRRDLDCECLRCRWRNRQRQLKEYEDFMSRKTA